MPRRRKPPSLPQLLDQAYLRIQDLLKDPDLDIKDLLSVFRALAYFKGTSTKMLPSPSATKDVEKLMEQAFAKTRGPNGAPS